MLFVKTHCTLCMRILWKQKLFAGNNGMNDNGK